jgi:hypothetical protein
MGGLSSLLGGGGSGGGGGGLSSLLGAFMGGGGGGGLGGGGGGGGGNFMVNYVKGLTDDQLAAMLAAMPVPTAGPARQMLAMSQDTKNPRNEGSTCVPMTWQVVVARP